jgi:hypothetical protein
MENWLQLSLVVRKVTARLSKVNILQCSFLLINSPEAVATLNIPTVTSMSWCSVYSGTQKENRTVTVSRVFRLYHKEGHAFYGTRSVGVYMSELWTRISQWTSRTPAASRPEHCQDSAQGARDRNDKDSRADMKVEVKIHVTGTAWPFLQFHCSALRNTRRACTVVTYTNGLI